MISLSLSPIVLEQAERKDRDVFSIRLGPRCDVTGEGAPEPPHSTPRHTTCLNVSKLRTMEAAKAWNLGWISLS